MFVLLNIIRFACKIKKKIQYCKFFCYFFFIDYILDREILLAF